MANFDTPPLQPTAAAEWHYINGGTQKGPISTADIQALLQSDVLRPENQVWRRGMDSLETYPETDLVATVADVPPPVPGDQIRNSIVWKVAILPLAVRNHRRFARLATKRGVGTPTISPYGW